MGQQRFPSDGGIKRVRSSASYGLYTRPDTGQGVLPSASASAWGSYIEISPAVNQSADSLLVGFSTQWQTSYQPGIFRIDFAVGAAGSERVIAEVVDTAYHYNDPVGYGYKQLAIPAHIPASTRLSCRIGMGNNSISVYIACVLAQIPLLESM